MAIFRFIEALIVNSILSYSETEAGLNAHRHRCNLVINSARNESLVNSFSMNEGLVRMNASAVARARSQQLTDADLRCGMCLHLCAQPG